MAISSADTISAIRRRRGRRWRDAAAPVQPSLAMTPARRSRRETDSRNWSYVRLRAAGRGISTTSHASPNCPSMARTDSRTRRRTRFRCTALPKRLPVITPRRTSRASSSRRSARSASAPSLNRAPCSSTRANAAAPPSPVSPRAAHRRSQPRASARGAKLTGRGRRSGARGPSAAVASAPSCRRKCACGARNREPVCGVAASVDRSASRRSSSAWA